MSFNPVVAFFDLDRTLLRVNSARQWVAYERRERRISRTQLAQAAIWLAGYRFGVLDIEVALGKAVSSLKGQHETQIAGRTHAWYDAEIAQTVMPEARAAVDWHRRQGHRLMLLTSSSPYISERVTADLKLDGFLCSRFEVRDGLFTGRAVLPFCYGSGKVALAETWAAAEGFTLANAWFYSDSYTDLPMLEAVGRPRVVNPDLRLRLEARRRNWPVADWEHGTRFAEHF